ncbi:MAG: hypothetical protein DRG24_05695, partial [Epsilonproteobacteria bacterium]
MMGILGLNFKYSLLFILLIILVGCVNTTSVVTKQVNIPVWYLNILEQQHEIIGYGSGNSLEVAKTVARNEIAKSLVVYIQSEFTVDVKVTEKTLTRHSESHITEYTNIVLTDAKVLRSKQVDHTFYVALSYENLPLGQKIKKIFSATTLPKMKQHSLYQNAFFSTTLQSLFGYKPAYELFFKNGLYYLHMEHETFVLKESELRLFFFEKQSEHVSIKVSSKQLKTNDFFHFNIAANEAGYLSLLQVDEEGRVIVHMDNLEFKANEKVIYPDLKFYDGLQAGIVNSAEQISEQYMALLCKKRIDFSLFEHASQSFNKNSEAMRYPELGKMIDE